MVVAVAVVVNVFFVVVVDVDVIAVAESIHNVKICPQNNVMPQIWKTFVQKPLKPDIGLTYSLSNLDYFHPLL